MASNTTNPTEYQDEQRVREDERARMASRTQPAYDDQMAGDPAARPTAQSTARPVAQPMAQPVYAAPAAGVTAGVAGDATQVIEADDRIRWGPVWGGTLMTFALFIVLEFLGVGLGLISPTNGNGVTGGVSTLIAALIAFLIGGWVAESTSIARGFGARLLTGLMVWALVTTLILAFSFFGLGTLFGALGSVAGQVSINGRTVSGAQPGNITQAAGWGAFIWLVISAILAMIGSLIGFPRRAHIARRSRM